MFRGFDRHDAGRRALAVAAALAVPLGAQLVVVHMVDADDAPLDPDAPGWETHVDEAVRAVADDAVAVLADAPVRWGFQPAAATRRRFSGWSPAWRTR